MYIYICVYIYRGIKRKRGIYGYLYIYIWICVYIYITRTHVCEACFLQKTVFFLGMLDCAVAAARCAAIHTASVKHLGWP